MPKLCTLKNLSYTFDGNCIFSDISWTLEEGKVYSVVGGNGTGKTVLAEIIAGRREPSSGEVVHHADGVGYFSFEEQEKVLARERRMDTTWFGDGKTDFGSTGAELLGFAGTEETGERQAEMEEYLDILKLKDVLDRGCKQYSTGEFRKVLICRELFHKPKLLIADEPYDGLDRESRSHLKEIFSHVKEKGTALLLFFSREEEVPEYTDEVKYLYSGSLYSKPSPRNAIENAHRHLHVKNQSYHQVSDSLCDAPLISMKNVEVTYEEKPVLKNINWQAKASETWMITGPNGSGKSTLLSLINGDNPKAYGQDIYLFGSKKGSGESIWDIKKRIGFVSGDFQNRYYIRASLRDVILSGFFDSIGLYRKVSEYEDHAAEEWLKDIQLLSKKNEPFSNLSFGEKRMALIARAMIKAPDVLIADEPCQGLDDYNSKEVLSTLEMIAFAGKTLLLYVTHDPKEFLRCPYHHMELVPADNGGYTNRINECTG